MPLKTSGDGDDAGAVPAGTSASGPAAPEARTRRVLVVDDDALQLRATQRALRGHARIELTTADNAIDALLLVGTFRPDVVLMDLYMPGLDGLEACRRITTNPATRHVEVILTSAAMTDDLARLSRAAGATHALPKPVDLGGLFTPGPELAVGTTSIAVVTPTVRGADHLVDMLVSAGVEVMFGLPGGAISPVHDALLDRDIRVVTTRHEAGAMFAAAAYARATGKLGVVAVTSGPGVLNSMTGLGSAWCDGVPLLLLVGEVPRAAHGKGVLQDGSAHGLQIVEMARHVAKLAVEVPRASALPHLLRRAIATAMSGRRGPVVMTLPLDVTTAQLTPPRIGGTMTVGGLVAAESLDEVRDLLARAQRPLILAGAGVRGGGAPARLVTVAERAACPVATTPKGKGVFPESHPLSLGVLGLGGHPSTRAYLERGVDLVIALGTSLGDMSTDGFTPLLQAAALVHVDIDARQIGRSYAPTHAIVASTADFLGGLADRLGEVPPARAPLAAPLGVRRHALPASERTDRIASHAAITTLQALLPADTIYTVDSGEHFLFAAHYLHLDHPDAFLVMTGLGSMGQSIGAAIGAQLAHPARAVAAICGDGCFAMTAFEIATAVQERLPIRVFVFNDQRLGMVEDGHRKVYGRQPLYPTGPLDVCLIARGLGAVSVRVSTVAELRAAEELLRHAPGPVVIDVAIDPAVSMPKGDRIAAMKEDTSSSAFGVPLETRPRVTN